ncbi:hypothetical protein ATY75_12185 [Rhizobium sp. N122]|uniref:hypothetical protein n=1 Tax=Rhizobium sp. N122 TaxID=1764272 RepID=UPI000B5A673E|nr:hypothetical protein [Rhizobium sp. N122]OWV62575.1 hypothetical protein ATY75_12185 [Rhizobium sp. N122]
MLLQIRAGEVPKLIKHTAKEIAGAFYDMHRTDQFRAQAGSQRQFVRRHWTDHVPVAIECLTGVLALPGTSEHEKEAIYDALTIFRERASAGTPSLSMRTLQ